MSNKLKIILSIIITLLIVGIVVFAPKIVLALFFGSLIMMLIGLSVFLVLSLIFD
jgi:hypothetical protein